MDAAMEGRESKGIIEKEMSPIEWSILMKNCKVKKEDMDAIIMNYLIVEGYKEVAENFAAESGVQIPVRLETIDDRMAVRNALQHGQVDEAVEKVNDLDPSVLESNPIVFFHLQQQRLIELIRQKKIREAIEFAQEELPSVCDENPLFMEEVEKTMTLLAFDNPEESPCGELMCGAQRHKLASELNSAILMCQNQEKVPTLQTLLQTLLWSQERLARTCSFPIVKNVTSPSRRSPTTICGADVDTSV